jgi:dTDP-4-dehydrorhamnose reductase
MNRMSNPNPPTTPPAENDSVRDVEHLEDLLSEPTEAVISTVRRLDGDFIILGVGGKMGPTLARMLRRALDAAGVRRRVIGVSRFSSGGLEARLNRQGIETISCDLLDRHALNALPEVANVVYMAGMKFGTTGQQSRTWAMNAYLPGMVAEKFRTSRIVAFSTGNVYPLVAVSSGGSRETDEPGPVGEYAMSCLGRERIFEHFSRSLNISMALVRLNYAVEMRYGVIVDMARRIRAGETIDLAMGNLNAIWQGDANAMAIRCFEHVSSPPFVLNLTGPEILSVRQVCLELGRRMGCEPIFAGVESGTALLSNTQVCQNLFGRPRVGPSRLIAWTADWTRRGGPLLDKPTHFEVRDGKF